MRHSTRQLSGTNGVDDVDMWTMLAIRELDDPTEVDLYPRPGMEPNTVIPEGDDGDTSRPVTVTALSVSVHLANDTAVDELLSAREIKASLYITDSRVAIACAKYDKGGGWVGGVGAIALNAASKVRAAARSRGRSLVGHVRLPWIHAVGYIEKTGWLSDESVRIVAADLTSVGVLVYQLDLVLPKAVSAKAVARDIVRRAARHRLGAPDLEDGDRAVLSRLVDPPEISAEKGKFALWELPGAVLVGDRWGVPVGSEQPVEVVPEQPVDVWMPPPADVSSPPEDVSSPPVEELPPPVVDGVPRVVTPASTIDQPSTWKPSSAAATRPCTLPGPGTAAWWTEPTHPRLPGATAADTDSSGSAAGGVRAAGWATDPFGRHELRYWDGAGWTAHVCDAGVVASDPPTGAAR